MLKRLVPITISTTIGLGAFLLFDFTAGTYFLPNPLTDAERPFVSLDHGWYELKKDFTGKDAWGASRYIVQTDRLGFRRAPGRQKNPAPADFIFLGDSFTYGINGPWEESFVGMFQARTGAVVLNAGVGSYSPTPYLYQYRKALSAKALKPGHVVVVGLDISDVQDEASHWVDGVDHPQKQEAELEHMARYPPDPDRPDTTRWPLTRFSYRLLRYGKQETTLHPAELVFDGFRSGFTWRNWEELDRTTAFSSINGGYSPLGVRGGLDRIEAKLGDAIALAQADHGRVYFLIYPWPAQLKHQDTFDWSAHVQQTCIKLGCDGVIDVIATFRTMVQKQDDWYERYYVKRDIHYNPTGNRVVLDALMAALVPGASR